MKISTPLVIRKLQSEVQGDSIVLRMVLSKKKKCHLRERGCECKLVPPLGQIEISQKKKKRKEN